MSEITSQILKQISDKVMADNSDFLDGILDKVILPSIKQNFDEEGRPEKWQELSERSQRERKFEGLNPSSPILVRFGDLILRSTARDGVSYKISKNKLTVSPDDERAYELQNGNEDRKLPARPFFFLQDEDCKTITKAFLEEVKKEVAKYSGKTIVVFMGDK